MAARKSRPVLYELIGQIQRPVARPRIPVAPQPTRPQPGRMNPAAPGPPGAAPAPESDHGSKFAAWIGRRLNLALSTPYLAAFAVAAVALLTLAYVAGRLSTSDNRETSSSLEQALTQKPTDPPPVDERQRAEPVTTHRPTRPVAIPPRPDQPVAEPAQPEAAAPAQARPPVEPAPKAEEPRAMTFESGKSYVIVQHLSKRGPGPQAAERIRDFLVAGGVPAAVHSGGPDLVVVATEPFSIDPKKRKDAADPERKRAQQLMDRIRKLGEQYVTNGYTFKDCYLREF